MEIGDKVYFNKYLALDSNGKEKKVNITINVAELNPFNEEGNVELRTVLVSPWVKKITDDRVEYKIREVSIEKKSGVFIGTFRKKLKRCYSKGRSNTPVVERETPLGIIREPVVRRPPRNLNMTSTRNPFRVDNPYSLDEVAIIAISNTRRYTVSMKHLLECNIRNKFKII